MAACAARRIGKAGRSGWAGRLRQGGACAGVLAAACLTAAGAGAQQAGSAADERVESLLARMTLEEKAGQMTQLTLMSVAREPSTDATRLQLDSAKIENIIVRHGVGSILNVWDLAETPEIWHQVIRTLQAAARRTRLGIPVLYGIDAVHGHNYGQRSTLFPQNIGLAATWNPDLVRRVNEITALEVRASGIPWNFSPVLDLGRHPLWPRFYETFGEDPFLASVLGAEAVRGLQGEGLPNGVRVAATGKHFVGYSLPLSGHDRTTAWIPERQLLEYFVPPFSAAIDAGLQTVMVNSGDVNGVPVHASRELLTDLLRTRLGFQGVVVTDWEDVIRLHTVHRVAATPREAVRMAVEAGIDMSMVPYDLSFHEHLVALVRAGVIPEARIDESVRRILKLKLDLGLFEQPDPDPALVARVGTPESHAVSLEAAEESITLLKNAGDLLPLSKQSRVLVTGPGANSVSVLHGGWTYTWQGANESAYPRDSRTVLQAVQDAVGRQRVTYVPGTSFTELLDVEAAVAAAKQADVAVVVLAERPLAEKPGDINDLNLPDAQRYLALAIEATGTPVVLVLLQNRPQLVRGPADYARAVVLGYLPGPHGADAIADVLLGDVNPSGKLPFTYPRYPNALYPYDHLHTQRIGPNDQTAGFDPQWEFGHGLSYTTFRYSNLRLDRGRVEPSDTLHLSVEVANTGSRAGKEVVQVYVRDLYASVAPPVKRLRAFDKIALEPGERRTVTFQLPVQRLAFIGLDNRPVVEPGEFEVLVGDQVERFVVTDPARR